MLTRSPFSCSASSLTTAAAAAGKRSCASACACSASTAPLRDGRAATGASGLCSCACATRSAACASPPGALAARACNSDGAVPAANALSFMGFPARVDHRRLQLRRLDPRSGPRSSAQQRAFDAASRCIRMTSVAPGSAFVVQPWRAGAPSDAGVGIRLRGSRRERERGQGERHLLHAISSRVFIARIKPRALKSGGLSKPVTRAATTLPRRICDGGLARREPMHVRSP